MWTLDSSPNSDSDDDFMVDSIMSSECRPSHSESITINQKCTPLMKKEPKCNKLHSVAKRNINLVSKSPLKPYMYNNNANNNNFVKEEPYSKFMKLSANIDSDCYSTNNRFHGISTSAKMDNSNFCSDYYSNAPSPFTESDKTHSVESSPSRIFLNDPIITSVVLNEKRFSESILSLLSMQYRYI